VSTLEIRAINPVRTDSWRSLHWIARLARWEATCGFCRTRFSRTNMFFWSSIVCPSCGARNLLPFSPRARSPR